ncbi:ABC transporter permease [Chondromyces crocatus]|uniref:Spermidine/putrescine ABC transporter permease n=1 Tax=Chondromyces crocatus TaxID=52 RepID=A0A0K1E885_CHOCO|nr:ABC transporter permease [Chondromyces crocatus]AKT37059.1 spermidine/putrescine ABC transporter permease [Chondromyces crocatus]
MTDREVSYGNLTTRRALFTQGALLLFGGLGWLASFLLLPGLILVLVAFLQRDTDGGVTWAFSLDSFRQLFGFTSTGLSSANLWIFLRSIALAVFTTVISVGLAYPMAFFIANAQPRRRLVWLSLVAIPLCTNLVIRTYAWKLLLSARLPPARLAATMGWIEAGRDLLPSWFAVCIGMISAALPFAVIALYPSVERLDRSLIEAAQDLYASPVRVFFQAILPQTVPGLSVAVLLTFVPAMGMFVITDMLGGAKHWLVGNLINHQFGPGRNVPYGAALSLVLIALTLVGVYSSRRQPGQGAEVL